MSKWIKEILSKSTYPYLEAYFYKKALISLKKGSWLTVPNYLCLIIWPVNLGKYSFNLLSFEATIERPSLLLASPCEVRSSNMDLLCPCGNLNSELHLRARCTSSRGEREMPDDCANTQFFFFFWESANTQLTCHIDREDDYRRTWTYLELIHTISWSKSVLSHKCRGRWGIITWKVLWPVMLYYT